MVILGTLGLVYAAVCALMYFAQRSLLYFPTPESAPAGAEMLLLQSASETLRIWTRPVAGPRALIYFGGNAEDVAGSFASFAAALPGYALYFANYRGYGGSSGKPTEAALFEDAAALYALVHQTHPQISVLGRSLGSGVAVYLASTRKVERLVLVTPYDSIVNVARARYPIFPVSLLMRDRFDSVSRLRTVAAKTLVLLAEHDAAIPRARSVALISAFRPGQAQVDVMPGSEHNTVDDTPAYLQRIAQFLL